MACVYCYYCMYIYWCLLDFLVCRVFWYVWGRGGKVDGEAFKERERELIGSLRFSFSSLFCF